MRARRLGIGLAAVVALALTGCQWTTFGYGAARTGANPTESIVGPANVASLQPSWSATIGPGPAQWEDAWSPAVGGTRVFVGTDDGVLRAFDRRGVGCIGASATCTPLWRATVGGKPLTPTFDRGVVFVTAGGTLFAFDATGMNSCGGSPRTCDPLWTAGPASGSPVVVGGRVFVSAGDAIEAFDAAGVSGCGGSPRTCSPVWTSTPAGCPAGATVCEFSSPSVDHGVVYAVWSGDYGLGEAELDAFDATGASGCSGTPVHCVPQWRAPVRANRRTPPPTIADGRVFVAGNFIDTLADPPATGSWFEAHDAATGALLWDARFSGQFAYTPAISAGHLYLGVGHVEVFDPAGQDGCVPNGGVRRCHETVLLRGPEVTVPVSVANGVLYAGSTTVRAYDTDLLQPGCATFGACPPQWEAASFGAATSAPVVSDGMIFVADAGGTLHAFAPGS